MNVQAQPAELVDTFRHKATRHWPAAVGIGAVAASTMAVFAYVLIDLPMAWWAHRELAPSVEAWFNQVTYLGSSQPWLIWGSVALVLCLLLKMWRRAAEAGLILASVAAAGMLTNLFKAILGRVRPEGLFQHDLHGFEFFHTNYHLTSFPSGHSATIGAAMTALVLLWPRLSPVWVALAIVVGLSRVMVTAHYPSDVIIGLYVGFAITLMLNALFCHLFGE